VELVSRGLYLKIESDSDAKADMTTGPLCISLAVSVDREGFTLTLRISALPLVTTATCLPLRSPMATFCGT
jgi:hypothetical protein